MVPETDTSFDVIVVGAGVSGLAAALRLSEHGKRVLLTADSDRVGGVMESMRSGDFLLEQGPNSYASFGDDEEKLLRNIGLSDRAIRRPISTTDRYIWHSGKLHKVPTGPLALLLSDIVSFSSRIKIIRGIFKRYQRPRIDMGLGEFFRSVIGDEAVETILKPGIAGIYAADADRISLRSTFPALGHAIFSNHRLISAIKSMRGKSAKRSPKQLTSFPDGLEELPKAMMAAACAKGVVTRLGVKIQMELIDDLYSIRFADGSAFTAREVILATPARATATLIEPFAEMTSAKLAAMEHASLLVVHAGVPEDQLGQRLDGFGFLSRRKENLRTLGMIWSSGIFPGRAPAGQALLTCFYGGEIDPEAVDLSDDEIKRHLLDDLRKAMKFTGNELTLFSVKRWTPALPVFRPNHAELVGQIMSDLPPGLHICSSWKGGVSIPDRIKDGWATADLIAGVKSN